METGEDPEAVFNEVLNRQKTVSAVQDTGIDFFSDIDGFFEDGKRIKARKTKTGFPKLDKFMEGGMDPGTLTVFMAPPKFGKTTILTNVGYANLIRGKKVAHISLELSARKAQRKYICRITNIPSGRLPRKQRKANKLLSRFKKRWGGQLKLKFYPTGSVHVGVLRSYLYSLRNRDGFNPDLVVVDYGDILMPTSKRKDSETDDYHGQGNVYEGLRALASELDCPVVTASQCKRAAATKVTIRMEDIADSYRKVAVADHIITLCRTEDETAKNRGRLFFAGSREAETWRWVPIRYNWKTSLIAEVHYDPEEDDEDGV
ncbi:MAG: hypothetical protein GWN86_24570 [Desulfobacterales bacterium]|nr:hypothetical protein [Desulfobacterales bacterium]